ncbi:EscU/YscU/HrcU family type III secretion system export apparatus switch protein [Nguyenibacter vanlangensis]|uniref:EscU/YscU/HrcU family type III secretion system export apparatus switch protein n=1 Tax=Nguyenibacter vanlangensis TaxID=1216886 RepID=A0A7Y7M5V0_9PROT|nr:EscU/YscU/HrcU family type III secretion system export apparatus switch protein [Nguyenibacter vanlangensis]NVN09863.1 EscU/YscU/HrcU family type III secretion system export apparatus switch protein [Nguyenibacter vanlangensis]
MPEEGSGGGERSQAPTEKRLQTAREDGNVAQSRELQMLVVLGAFLIVFTMTTATAGRAFLGHMHGLMEHFDTISPDMPSVYTATLLAGREGALLAAPLALASLVVVVACSMLQTGFLFRPQALVPDITRLSPIRGLTRLFSVTNLVELLKSLVKFVVFGLLLYGVAQGTLRVAPEAERWTIPRLSSELMAWFAYATLIILVVQCVIAVLDDLWTRYHRLNGLRMSLQDIKEETRQTDGDPHVKAKLKVIRRRRARQRMIQAVRKATVVVTNPTHYAVALSYENGADGAPKIVAKGMDELAARIRHAAEDAKVPVVSNPSLARALYTLPLDAEIPPEYFQPVAAIIAYVMKLRTPGSRAPRKS